MYLSSVFLSVQHNIQFSRSGQVAKSDIYDMSYGVNSLGLRLAMF